MSEELKPARYEEPSRRAFAPRLPWRIALFVAVALLGLIAAHRYQEQSRALQLRTTIVARYEANAVPIGERVSEFRERIEGWVAEVAHDVPETWADERLNLAGLHRAQGVYLRLNEAELESPATVAEAAMAMTPDAIARCLGLSPVSMGGFYHKLHFFSPAWLEGVEEAEAPMRLRVLEAELENKLAQDVPLLMDMVHSSYFMLAIQRGENRQEHPVDVYIWDLRRNALLLKTRTRSRGTLINVRIGIGGDVIGPGNPPPSGSGAADCSIASQVRAAAGAGAAEVVNEQPSTPAPSDLVPPAPTAAGMTDLGASEPPGAATQPVE